MIQQIDSPEVQAQITQQPPGQFESLTMPGASGIGLFIVMVLSAIGWWWKNKQDRPRTEADMAADISKARFDQAATEGGRAMFELMRQHMEAQQAQINDLSQRFEASRKLAEDAQSEVMQLRAEQAKLKRDLDLSNAQHDDAVREVERLRGRVAVLEDALRKAGREVPA